jgi:hypothetical protein
MKERPILFSAPMIQALLAGTKTQTRRAVKPQPVHAFAFIGRDDRPTGEFGLCLTHDRVVDKHVRCPYGQPGDRLYVKEKHAFLDVMKSALSRFPLVGGGFGPDIWNLCVEYCDGTENDAFSVEGEKPRQTRERGEDRWRQSIHMPRWASRILLEITAVRVERLQDISEADALAEGVNVHPDHQGKPRGSIYSPVQAYRDLWESINGPDVWAVNPWVWVVEFRRVVP